MYSSICNFFSMENRDGFRYSQADDFPRSFRSSERAKGDSKGAPRNKCAIEITESWKFQRNSLQGESSPPPLPPPTATTPERASSSRFRWPNYREVENRRELKIAPRPAPSPFRRRGLVFRAPSKIELVKLRRTGSNALSNGRTGRNAWHKLIA